MCRGRRVVTGYVWAGALAVIAALIGCGGMGREEIPPAFGPGKSMDAGGVVIEIVNEPGKDREEEGSGGVEPDTADGGIGGPDMGRGGTAGTFNREEQGNDGDWKEYDHGATEDAGGRALPDPAQVYPGEILNKEEAEETGVDGFFTCSAISDQVFSRMYGNSYKEDCTVPREDLRYLRILHYDFSGNIRVGELVCSRSVSRDLLYIFRELYEAEYPIEKVVLIDDYGGDDDLSSQDNNTSCFNYRTVAGSGALSLHGLGVAVDINPLYNPYITWNAQGEAVCAPSNGAAYMDRSMDFPYKIDENDLCCRLFTQAGFTWGGNWEGHRDYMHFSRSSKPET